MKKILLNLLLFVVTISTAQEKYHRAKINFSTIDDLYQLQELGIPMEHGIQSDALTFESDFSESELQLIKQSGIKHSIVIEDVKQFYLDQNNPESEHYVSPENAKAHRSSNFKDYETPKNFNLGSMGGYLTYSEAMQELDDMYDYCQENGIDIITKRKKIEDFHTAEGRHIYWLKLSDNPNIDEEEETQTLYTSIHHAREPTSLQQLIFFMWYVIENYSTSVEIQNIVNNNELYFVPVVNPDGYVYNEKTDPQGGGLWRKNRNGKGVDINRNYSYITPQGVETWNTTGVSSDPKSNSYPGTAPFSEVETQALRYFVEAHNFNLSLNHHSSGDMFFYPFGYKKNKLTPDHDLFVRYAEIMATENGFGHRATSQGNPLSGISNDYMYGTRKTKDGSPRKKMFAYTPEIGHSFWLPKNEITDVCKSMVFTNLVGAKISNKYAILEDASPEKASTYIFPVDFNLTRLGLTETTYKVSITPVSENIESVEAEKAFNIANPDETVSGVLNITLKNTVKEGETFTFKLNLDNGDYIESQTITKTADQTLSTTNSTYLDNHILVHPNPVNDYLNITTTLSNFEIKLVNTQGQILLNKKCATPSTTINYSAFPKGVYLLNITSNGKQKTFKIVK